MSAVEIAGTCPGCGQQSLSVMGGGHITCRRIECPDPTAASRLLHTQPAAGAIADPRENVLVFVGGRRSGKTERLIQWVAAGEPTAGYPFWSRIVLAVSREQAEILRRELRGRFPKHDVYRWVFDVDDWARARIGRTAPEVAIDNADVLLRGIVQGPIAAMTLSGAVWPAGESS